LSGKHANGAHRTDDGATQLPLPSHVLDPKAVFALALQDGEAQTVVAAHLRHAR
jgi:hypothetical protein